MAYIGKVLRINLTEETKKVEPFPVELAKKFIGGRGLASKILFDEINPKIDPLSEANKIIFATGPLTGTTAPTGGRYMVVTKGPLTGTIASSNSGGFFGASMKSTGYDMVILEGKATKPVYIKLDENGAEIKDAAHLWGKDTHETTDILVEEVGNKRAKVACIGPAGEKLSKIACIMNDKHRAAGRTGVGAVLGSKNVKAIVTIGSKKAELKREAEFKAAVKAKMKKIKENETTAKALAALGTKGLDHIINANGMYPTNNFQKVMFEGVDEISGEALVEKLYFKKNSACYACPIACGRRTELPNGRKGEGPEYESGWSYGALCGVNDLVAITTANFMCNELGIDPISAGVTVATAMELYERGIIKKEDLNKGPELKFGNSEAIIYYTKALVMREGLGAKMADGAYRLAESYGHPEYAMTVKKQEIAAYDLRGVQGHGLATATSNRGGCHVRGYIIPYEITGVPEKVDPQQLNGKPELVKTIQDLAAVIDSAGLCLFTSFALNTDDYNDLLKNATGFETSTEEMMQNGERIWNLERLFNLKAGITHEDDTLPKRFFDEPASEGPNKGKTHQLAKLLPEYYKVRGWDKNGVPTDEKLRELGL